MSKDLEGGEGISYIKVLRWNCVLLYNLWQVYISLSQFLYLQNGKDSKNEVIGLS